MVSKTDSSSGWQTASTRLTERSVKAIKATTANAPSRAWFCASRR